MSFCYKYIIYYRWKACLCFSEVELFLKFSIIKFCMGCNTSVLILGYIFVPFQTFSSMFQWIQFPMAQSLHLEQQLQCMEVQVREQQFLFPFSQYGRFRNVMNKSAQAVLHDEQEFYCDRVTHFAHFPLYFWASVAVFSSIQEIVDYILHWSLLSNEHIHVNCPKKETQR